MQQQNSAETNRIVRPTMNNLPKFLESGQTEPKMSTKEYWGKLNFAMLLHPSKIQVNELMAKQSTAGTTLNAEELLNIKACKASFIMAVGDQTLKEIQARNPKEEVLEKDLKWTKEKWDEIWKTGQVQNQNFVKIMQAKKENSESVMQFWTRLSGLVAKCKLETIQTAEIENALQVAGFTNEVGDTEMVKSIWEKKNDIRRVGQTDKRQQ